MMVEFVGGPLDGQFDEMGYPPPPLVVCEMPRAQDEMNAQAFTREVEELPDSTIERPKGRYSALRWGKGLVYRWDGEY